MKAIFYILALLVTAGAAYFSFDVSKKFEAQKTQKEETLQRYEAMNKKGNAKQADLDKEQLGLDEAEKAKANVEASIDKLAADETALRGKLKTLDSDLEAQAVKFADLKKIQEQVAAILQGAGADVTLENLPERITELEADLKTKTGQLEELTTNVAAATKAVESNQAEIGRLADRSASRSSRIRRNSMESVVSAVNEEWGFVIIAAGSNTGFQPQTKLLIKRDGRLIAEVKPSSIEPSQTIAEIDTATLAPGVRIQPGDRVILAEPATN